MADFELNGMVLQKGEVVQDELLEDGTLVKRTWSVVLDKKAEEKMKEHSKNQWGRGKQRWEDILTLTH